MSKHSWHSSILRLKEILKLDQAGYHYPLDFYFGKLAVSEYNTPKAQAWDSLEYHKYEQVIQQYVSY